MINIQWYGHSMWKVSTEKVSMVFDPFGDIGYPMPKDIITNIVISSHEHPNHSNFKLFPIQNYKKITQMGTYHLEDIKIKLIEVSHGQYNGKKLGDSFISIVKLDGISIIHCGDIGVIPNFDVMKEISDADILFIPIGGNLTINAELAKIIIDHIKPKIVFPMHYKTEVLKINNIEGVEPFLSLYPETEVVKSDNVNISKENFNSKKIRIFKLDYPVK